MKCTLLCPTVVHSHHSLSPFSPFTGAIQQRVFVHGANDFEGCITLSMRFRWHSEGSGCVSCRRCRRHRHQPCINTMIEESHLTTLLYLDVSKGVQCVGNGAVLELKQNSSVTSCRQTRFSQPTSRQATRRTSSCALQNAWPECLTP